MTQPIRLLLPLLCLLFLSACTAGRDSDAQASGDPFRGDPKVTPQVHFLSGQLMESKIASDTDAGKLSDTQANQYRTAALAQYAAALKLDPNHTPSLHRSGVLLSQMKRHEQALAMWSRYVEATGRTPNSLVNLGLALEMAGRHAQAEETYREATRIDPAHKHAHVNLGLLLARQGQMQPAQSALSVVLDAPAVHWHLGLALEAAGRSREADQQFRAAAALDPAYAQRPRLPSAASAKVD